MNVENDISEDELGEDKEDNMGKKYTRVKSHLRKVKGKKKRVRVRSHLRKKKR